jgi:uncharacterized protein involved in exopolysaccharide biosynthesis
MSLLPRHVDHEEMSSTGYGRRRGVGLRECFTILWARRGFIIIVSLIVSLGSFTTALVLPKSYAASAILAPVSAGPGNETLSAATSPMSLGGLSELLGATPGAESKKAEAVASLESDTLTEKYIRDNNLLPVLYAGLWDAAGMRWKVSDPRKIPTLWRAGEFFKKNIRTIKTDPRTGMVTLTIVWKDPELAATWANGLVRMANDYLRAHAIADSERNVTYLNKELTNTSLVEAQRVIYSVLRTEISKQMLARGTREYAFKVIDPALVVERPAFPNRVVWLVVGLLVGLFLSCFLVTLRAALV